ncbi:putative enoyl-CoA hydratase echA8 [Planctomycetes bacterium Poly30]|uniref:Putative enoyl-CoA hydratase echA8 n=1 Tax=Saltatorellus ferox TaxID=2528018 RepID=A0A518ER86_9BACT|nr:putative enoyl-CoA hydratase echA8 [Planctomycetes bacterium Poly30]
MTPEPTVLEQFPSDVPDQPELVTMSREGDLVWLTIDRPEVMNCLSFPTLRRFRTLLEELRGDLSIRCILITGAGERAFCAGADLKERKTMPAERVPDFVRNIRGVMDDVANMPQPTVAVVQGFAFGGGTELMLACDLRIAASEATFGLTETTLAIIPGAGGTQRLPRLIGSSRAKDLILTGRKLDAAEAERIGLLNRVAPRAELRAAATELAETIASNGPVAVRAAKAAIDLGTEAPIQEGLEIEAKCYERVLPTQDRLEALAAFAEKRKPRYEGR